MRVRNLVLVASGATLLGGFVVMGMTPNVSAQNSLDKANGQAVYNHWCAPCHAAGPGHPGTQSLEIKYRDSKITSVLEERDDLTAEFVKTIVRNGILSMAPFRKTEITDSELDAIVAYLSKRK